MSIRMIAVAAVLSSIVMAVGWIVLWMRATGNEPVNNGWRELEGVDSV